MLVKQNIIDQLCSKALVAIKTAYGTEEDEFGATLFVSHHLEELDESYWKSQFQTASPDPTQILESLVISPYCIDEDDEEIDSLDFILPGEVSDYLLCVCFEEGEVCDISMES